MSKEKELEPVFAFGFPRSGTTLLASVLERHPEICATPETHFLTKVCRRSLLGTWNYRQPATSVDKLLSQPYLNDISLNISRGSLLRKDRPPNPATFFRSLLTDYGECRNARIVVEKTPEHLLHALTLANWFPNAKFVCVVRDGRDVVSSVIKMPGASQWLAYHAASWSRFAAKEQRIEKHLAGRYLRIRYEDLIENPIAVVSNIDKFIGVQFHQNQITPSNNLESVPEWEMPWKAKTIRGFDPKRCYAYRTSLSQETQDQLTHIMREPLLHYGYNGKSNKTPRRCYSFTQRFLLGLAVSHPMKAARRLARKCLTILGKLDPIPKKT
ncbi:sulfotransferase family protein [Rhodopirellula baltica]|uniref:sulfotransferase family protein n=1 Tax=Rhodopirellula baltica TaxID=265606 RepID=UPI00130D6896|nr:sulfotransferase [Rhodopirellula baltica]